MHFGAPVRFFIPPEALSLLQLGGYHEAPECIYMYAFWRTGALFQPPEAQVFSPSGLSLMSPSTPECIYMYAFWRTCALFRSVGALLPRGSLTGKATGKKSPECIYMCAFWRTGALFRSVEALQPSPPSPSVLSLSLSWKFFVRYISQ